MAQIIEAPSKITKTLIITTATDDDRAIEIAPGVYLVPGDADAVEVADATAVCPLRTDLPESHPLYGTRALAVVPSGCPDLLVDENGIIDVEDA